MRNVFDQYEQPENRLTHSLVVALYQDRKLLRSFLQTFGFKNHPPLNALKVIEQGLPGAVIDDEEQADRRGLPDALVYDESGWALIIESKVSSALTKNQLSRHYRTIQKCGFDKVHGLAITVTESSLDVDDWRGVTWKDIYSWGNHKKHQSQWAKHMVEYFNVAENKMINTQYLQKGTITEFSGISFDPYTYLEAKRILRLLTGKLRENKAFITDMGLDAESGRSAITDQGVVWDFISFKSQKISNKSFTQYPHCTVGIGPDKADAMVTFPNGLNAAMRKRLHGESFEDFTNRLQATANLIKRNLKDVKKYRPTMRVAQRRYKTQSSIPHEDGNIAFDIRTASGDLSPHYGPPIKQQPEWARNAYELVKNKNSNIQLQIGIEFQDMDELNHKDADRHFVASFQSLKPFVQTVLD